MPKKNTWSVKMVNPSHIAQKKYWGCSTPKSVQNFCTRYNINRFWWRPPEGGRKVLMVDFQDFRDNYKEVYGNVKTKKTTASWKKSNKSMGTKKTTRFSSKTHKSPRKKSNKSRSW